MPWTPTIKLSLTDMSDSKIVKEFNSKQRSIPIGRGGRSNNSCQSKSSGLFRTQSTKVMSQKHAMITWDLNNAFLSDVGSTNGTTVKRDGEIKNLIPDVAYRLKTGDIVTFGKQTGGNGTDSTQRSEPISLKVDISLSSDPSANEYRLGREILGHFGISSRPPTSMTSYKSQKPTTIHSSLSSQKRKGYGISEKELLSPDLNSDIEVIVIDDDVDDKIEIEEKTQQLDKSFGLGIIRPPPTALTRADGSTDYVLTPNPVQKQDTSKITEKAAWLDRAIEEENFGIDAARSSEDFENEQERIMFAYEKDCKEKYQYPKDLADKSSPTKIKVINPPSSPIPSQAPPFENYSIDMWQDQQQYPYPDDIFDDDDIYKRVEEPDYPGTDRSINSVKEGLVSEPTCTVSIDADEDSDIDEVEVNSERKFIPEPYLELDDILKSSKSRLQFKIEKSKEEVSEEELKHVTGKAIAKAISNIIDSARREGEEDDDEDVHHEEVEEDAFFASVVPKATQAKVSEHQLGVRFHFDSPTSNSSRLPSPVSDSHSRESSPAISIPSNNSYDDDAKSLDLDLIKDKKTFKYAPMTDRGRSFTLKTPKQSRWDHLPSPSPELNIHPIDKLTGNIMEFQRSDFEYEDVNNSVVFDEDEEIDRYEEDDSFEAEGYDEAEYFGNTDDDDDDDDDEEDGYSEDDRLDEYDDEEEVDADTCFGGRMPQLLASIYAPNRFQSQNTDSTQDDIGEVVFQNANNHWQEDDSDDEEEEGDGSEVEVEVYEDGEEVREDVDVRAVDTLSLISGPLFDESDQEDANFLLREEDIDESQEKVEVVEPQDEIEALDFESTASGKRIIPDVEIHSEEQSASARTSEPIVDAQIPRSSVFSPLKRRLQETDDEVASANITTLSTLSTLNPSPIIDSTKVEEDRPVTKRRRINLKHVSVSTTIGFVSGVIATVVGLNALESYMEGL